MQIWSCILAFGSSAHIYSAPSSFSPTPTYLIPYPCYGDCPPSFPLLLFFVCLLSLLRASDSTFTFTLFILFQVLESFQLLPGPLLSPLTGPPVILRHLFMAFGIIKPGAPPDSVPTKPHFQVLTACRPSASLNSLH